MWRPETDPLPLYKEDIEEQPAGETENVTGEVEPEDERGGEAAREFTFERDLRNYLGLIEPGLQLYDEEGITGVEFPVGGRFIDILALDRHDRYVVIELKVYARV